MTQDAQAVDALGTPELESLVAARKVLASGYALPVAVEEQAQAVTSLHDTAWVALEAGNSPEVIFGHYRDWSRRKTRAV